MNAPDLAGAVKAEARRLGFDFCRIAATGEAPHAAFFEQWVAAGRPASMHYLERNLAKRRAPALLAEPPSPPFRTLIVLGVDYHRFDLPPALLHDPRRGIIARYAWGDDYHEIIRPLLHRLDAFLAAQTGRTTHAKALVDSGPVLERDWAQRAGMGFLGKNCCLIHPQRGSWLLLATLLVPEALEPDPPPAAHPAAPPEPSPASVFDGLPPSGHYGRWEIARDDGPGTATGTCGGCTRCLTACPTDAFRGPYHLEPARCISYWTIETQEPIPRALRPRFGNRIFGCDICQEVCPWNRRLGARTPLLEGLHAQEGRVAPPLLEGFAPQSPYWLDDAAFAARFRRSPLKRARRQGMLRNVCVALGNWAAPETVPALALALNDPHAAARGHAAWALGAVLRRQPFAPALDALHARRRVEADPWVREELAHALA